MCAGPFRPKKQVIQQDPRIAAEQEAAEARALEEAKNARKEALSERLTQIGGKGRRGAGRRSLLTSSRGGMGYYNEYLK